MKRDVPPRFVREILIAVDGEPHTVAAIDWALALAQTTGAKITALYVKDPYLKQFYNDIYAQGRQAYLDHVDACLAESAEAVLADFVHQADSAGANHRALIRAGDPLEEIVAAITAGDYDLVVTGGEARKVGRRPARDLPARLAAGPATTPLVIIRN